MLTKLCKLFHDEEADSSHGAVILLNNADLRSVCAAFSLMEAPELRMGSKTEAYKILIDGREIGDMARAWRLVWECAIVRMDELSARSGVPRGPALTSALDRLIGARLIYPDGSISRTAKDILNSLTIRELEKATGSRQAGGGQE